jgi:acyl carrier protein
LVELEDVLQRDEPCHAEDVLAEYEEWDSLSKMAVMAFFNKHFGIKLTLDHMKDFITVQDLIAKAGL